MNRRNFLKQFGVLAAAGLILPETVTASGFQVIIPAQGVVPAAPPGPTGSIKPFGSATALGLQHSCAQFN